MKLQLISELILHTAKQITNNPQNWKEFLNTAARQYKYQFSNQLLIYAQKPETSACATMDVWNKKLGRWINAGSKGIAIIDDTKGMPKLKYVFDISDTHAVQGGKTPWLWELKERTTSSNVDISVYVDDERINKIDPRKDKNKVLETYSYDKSINEISVIVWFSKTQSGYRQHVSGDIYINLAGIGKFKLTTSDKANIIKN